MVLSKLEFAVEDIKDADSLKKSLSETPGVSKVNILKNELVILETSLTCSETVDVIQKLANSRAVLQGFGDGESGVAILQGKTAQGVIRLTTDRKTDSCILDGTVDGLIPGGHLLNIHASGDLTRGCESLGPVFSCAGNIEADTNGRANFKFSVPDLQVNDIVGRSVAIMSTENGERVTCGIIARSAGLFENSKKICLCDGVTVWDERNVPAAGQGRRKDSE